MQVPWLNNFVAIVMLIRFGDQSICFCKDYYQLCLDNELHSRIFVSITRYRPVRHPPRTCQGQEKETEVLWEHAYSTLHEGHGSISPQLSIKLRTKIPVYREQVKET